MFDQLSDGVFLLPPGREDLPLKNTPVVTPSPSGREDDRFDVGFVRLTAAEVATLPANAFLSLPEGQASPDGDTPNGYVLYGFPWRRQRADGRNRRFQLEGTS